MKKILILVLIITLCASKSFAQLYCGGTSPFKNIHDFGFDVCFTVPAPGTYNYKYEVRSGSTSGPIVVTGYDTKDETNSFTSVVGLSSNTLYFFRATYETSPGVWSSWMSFKSVTTSDGFFLTPALDLSTDQNFLATITYKTAGTPSTLPTTKEGRTVNLQYYDGLGRPSQLINYQGSPDGRNMVQINKYDDFGREEYMYLPFVSNQTTAEYNLSAFVEQDAFYNSSTSPAWAAEVAKDAVPRAQNVFEDSPLSRVKEAYGVGLAWSSNGSDKPVTYDYSANSSSEVDLWKVDDAGLPYKDGYYAANTLNKVVTTDENGFATMEYTDKGKRLILKRIQMNTSATEWAYTYYVYDNVGNLRYVLPPKITDEGVSSGFTTSNPQYVKEEDLDLSDTPDPGEYFVDKGHTITLSDGFQFTATSGNTFTAAAKEPMEYYAKFGDLAFEYQYDKQNRMIAKKVPGADWVYMVYDKWDRLVLTQDGNQRASNEWIYTKYDKYNRPIQTGIATDSRGRQEIQNALHASVYTTRFETRNGSTYEYTNNCYPNGSTISEVLTVTLYDSYPTFSISYPFASVSGYVSSGDKNNDVKGQVTATMTKVLGTTSDYLHTVNYYDDKYRLIQSFVENDAIGYDRITNKLDFIGQVTKSQRYHQANGINKTIEETYTYDHGSRLISQTTSVDGSSSTVDYEYNELGELIEKDLNGAQSVDYRYNIRGLLTTINNGTSFDSGENDRFGMELEYEGAGQFNGNIGRMNWKSTASSGNNGNKKYDFSYDPMNRLNSALYNQGISGDGAYDVSGITYDANGNIETLIRKHNGANADNLDYDYSGNKLISIGDSYGNILFDEEGSEGKASNEYLYDANGNMIRDLNKGISNITYNFLNLPETVTTSEGTVNYTYSADGIKLRKLYDPNSGSDVETEYIGGLHYKDGALSFMQHSEGTYLFSSSEYNYNLTDHLGNVRVTVDESGTVVQRDDYYPFGLTFNHWHETIPGQSENLYRFIGKEEQEETDWLDFGARMYEPAVGRWFAVDPLADVDHSISFTPYHYVANNPIINIDLDGRDWYLSYDGSIIYDEKIRSQDELDYYGILGLYLWGNPDIGADGDEEDEQSGGSGTPSTTSDPTLYGWGFTGFVAGGKTAYGEIVRQQGINNVLTNTSDAPLKIPKGVKFVGKFGGVAFTVWGAIDIEQQYQSGQINSYWRNAEQVSNGIGAVPVIGTAWSVGWELGRFITQTDFYRYNIKGEYKCVNCPE